MRELEEKVLPGGVRVARSPGRLVVRIRSGGMLSLMHAAVFGGIAWLVLPKIMSLCEGCPPETSGRALAIAIAGFFLSRFFLDQQVLEVFQGRLIMAEYVSVFRYSSKEFDLGGISGLGVNIPEGKNHPGYIKLPKNPPIPKDAISFFHGGQMVSFAPGLERLAATYIINELRREGVPGPSGS